MKRVVDKSKEIILPVKNGPVTKLTKQSLIPETIKLIIMPQIEKRKISSHLLC